MKISYKYIPLICLIVIAALAAKILNQIQTSQEKQQSKKDITGYRLIASSDQSRPAKANIPDTEKIAEQILENFNLENSKYMESLVGSLYDDLNSNIMYPGLLEQFIAEKLAYKIRMLGPQVFSNTYDINGISEFFGDKSINYRSLNYSENISYNCYFLDYLMDNSESFNGKFVAKRDHREWNNGETDDFLDTFKRLGFSTNDKCVEQNSDRVRTISEILRDEFDFSGATNKEVRYKPKNSHALIKDPNIKAVPETGLELLLELSGGCDSGSILNRITRNISKIIEKEVITKAVFHEWVGSCNTSATFSGQILDLTNQKLHSGGYQSALREAIK